MKPEKKAKLMAEIAAAETKIADLKAQLACSLGAAFDALPKTANYKGSAVVLTIRKLGGGEIVGPVAIVDGLSATTIHALQADIARSFEIATLVNPAMAGMVHS